MVDEYGFRVGADRDGHRLGRQRVRFVRRRCGYSRGREVRRRGGVSGVRFGRAVRPPARGRRGRGWKPCRRQLAECFLADARRLQVRRRDGRHHLGAPSTRPRRRAHSDGPLSGRAGDVIVWIRPGQRSDDHAQVRGVTGLALLAPFRRKFERPAFGRRQRRRCRLGDQLGHGNRRYARPTGDPVWLQIDPSRLVSHIDHVRRVERPRLHGGGHLRPADSTGTWCSNATAPPGQSRGVRRVSPDRRTAISHQRPRAGPDGNPVVAGNMRTRTGRRPLPSSSTPGRPERSSGDESRFRRRPSGRTFPYRVLVDSARRRFRGCHGFGHQARRRSTGASCGRRRFTFVPYDMALSYGQRLRDRVGATAGHRRSAISRRSSFPDRDGSGSLGSGDLR